MREAIEIVGALIVLALAWICIAEVFPQYEYFRDEQMVDEEEWRRVNINCETLPGL